MKRLIAVFIILVMFFPLPQTISAYENLTPSGIQIKDLESYIDEYVDDYIGKTVAGANIIIIKDNQIVFSKGYGYADMEKEIPMDPTTDVLEWGSISKLFVWVAVMQLVERGKLELTEDIRTYLPEGFLTKLSYDEPITMLDLMNHQAGFEDNLFDLGYASMNQVKSLEEGLRLAEPRQAYRPGEVVAYSNYSTSLAAFVIERITGEKFYEYVSDQILTKLGMNHTSPHLAVEENQEIIQAVTKGYQLEGIGEFKESPQFFMYLYPSGAMNGTVEDLAKFAIALMPKEQEENRLFEKEETWKQLLSTSYSANESVPGIAHGFWEEDGKKRGYTHSGNTAAFSSNLHIVPEDHFAVIILTNQAGEADLTFGLTKALTGQKIFEPVQHAPSASEVEGTYMPARKMGSGFLQLYYYLSPFEVTALNNEEIQVSTEGVKANYIQEDPYTYRFMDGDSAFLPLQFLHFQIEDGTVQQVSAAFSDWLPMDKKGTMLKTHGLLFGWTVVYFLLSSIILAVFAIISRTKKRSISPVSKWAGWLHVSSNILIVNVFVLAARMFFDSNRAYSEVIFHFGVNYLFTFTSIFSIAFILWHWKKSGVTQLQKILYPLSMLSSVVLIYLLIYWQFYF